MSTRAHAAILPSNIETLFANALKDYAIQTGDDLATHPLFSKIKICDSVESIAAVLQEQADAFHKFRKRDQKVAKWLEPTINVINMLSGTLSEAVSLAFPPGKVIFAGIGILLVAFQGVNASYDVLDGLFESISHFLMRLKIYSEIPSTPAIAEIIAKILIELISVLALATKEVKQGRLKKFGKKIFGEKDIESMLQRLDRLTQEEARMTVAQTLGVVHGLVTNVKEVMDDGKELANDMSKSKRERFQRDVRRWLSPPDPSKNHNIACKSLHEGTATWFIKGETFKEWKSTGSLLWIHGKPGSGKSILCSTIIQNIKAARDAGSVSMAYFYFDFRDTTKQDLQGLLSSLLIQLSALSSACSLLLSTLYSTYGHGSEEPSDDALSLCLKDILEISCQGPTYIIIDALDECSNTSGLPSPREQVLSVIEDLVNLAHSNLHICVTSRPESDIRAVLEPLTSLQMSLHEENGQKLDIIDYINSVVPSDPKMRRWRAEDKQLVIDTLSRSADGMFRWVFCQFQRLRHCLPGSIRRVLGELPSTLDETYERVLQDIHEDNWEYARRLFQSLIAASRPLRVQELAEVLAIRFDSDDTKIPKLEPGWRPDDEEEAVMSTCSSLITTVETNDSRVVQFSHFSVKEFLTSTRLSRKEGVSRFHIVPKSAHTFLVQACIGVLLQLDKDVDREKMKNFALAHYAARHWFDHAGFEDVSSEIRDGMEDLFNPKKRHFRIWAWLYDMERSSAQPIATKRPLVLKAMPLHYAALCGFRDVVEWLVTTHSQDVNARSQYLATPLHHVSHRGHLDLARFLVEHGADVNVRDKKGWTPLRMASSAGHADIVQLLLEHGAEVNVRSKSGATPLHRASLKGNSDVVRLLLKHGANLHSRSNKGWTPLCQAADRGSMGVAQLLLEHGGDANASDGENWTPLHKATQRGHLEIIELLLRHGAEIDYPDRGGWTPLHRASAKGHLLVLQLLLDHGADVNSQSKAGRTALHLASSEGDLETARLLLKRGADTRIKDNLGRTPLDSVNGTQYPDLVKLLSQPRHGVKRT